MFQFISVYFSFQFFPSIVKEHTLSLHVRDLFAMHICALNKKPSTFYGDCRVGPSDGPPRNDAVCFYYTFFPNNRKEYYHELFILSKIRGGRGGTRTLTRKPHYALNVARLPVPPLAQHLFQSLLCLDIPIFNSCEPVRSNANFLKINILNSVCNCISIC